MTHPNFRTPLVPALLLLAVIGLFLLGNHFAQKSNPGETTIAPKTGTTIGPEEQTGNRSHLSRTSSILELPTKLEREENNTLYFLEPEIVLQDRIPGKRFPKSIFQREQHNQNGPLTSHKHTISAFDVAYDEATLRELIQSNSDEFSLPLTKEEDTTVRIDEILSRGPETFSILGKVLDEEQSNVLLVFHDGAVFGNVTYYDTNRHFEFGVSGDGDIAVRLLDPTSYTSPCGNPGAEIAEDLDTGSAPSSSPASPGSSSSASAESLTLIDYVVGYGTGAKNAEGGLAAIEAKIIASVDRTNLAFSNSMIEGIQFVLLGTVEDPAYVYPGAVSGDMGSADELGDLNSESDGVLDAVTNLKNSLGADGAAFVIQGTDGSAGIAYRPGDSMIVARTYMTSTRITFVHELGHNIGCQHGWGDNTGQSLSLSNYGWRLDPPSSGRVRTVMAYNWSWTRIPYFSNPAVQYAGANTGAVDGYDATGDSTADSSIVSGGYDGTNPNLGANNADYIVAQAQYLADNAVRPAPALVLEDANGNPFINSPSSLANFNSPAPGTPVSQTFTIRNDGVQNLEDIAVTLSGANSSEFSLGTVGATTLTPGQTTTFTVDHTLDNYSIETALLEIASNDPDDPVFEVTLSAAVRTVLAEESFESGFGAWTNSSGNELDWSRRSGTTPSSGTGPNSAADQSYYLYTEASGNSNKTARVESTFDFSAQAGVTLGLSYHMYGSSMGTLHLDVFDGLWTESVWSLSGQQQGSNAAAWGRVQIDLSDYAGQNNIILRLRGVTGPSFTSDICIDDIQILGSPLTYTLTYTSDGNGALSGDTNQIVVAGGDGTAVEAFAYQGYEFAMWSDGSKQNPRTDTSVSSNLTLEALFEETGINSFSDWATENGLTGNDALPLATPDNDGIENLKKYAFNMTQPTSGPTILIPVTGTSGLPHVSLPAGPASHLTVEYIRRKNATDLVYTVEFSDLMQPGSGSGGWSASGNETSVTSIDDDWERVIVEDSVESAFADYRWVRVTIQQTSP